MKTFIKWIENRVSPIAVQPPQNPDVIACLKRLSHIGNYYSNMILPTHLHEDIDKLYLELGNTQMGPTIENLKKILGAIETSMSSYLRLGRGQAHLAFTDQKLKNLIDQFNSSVQQISQFVD